MRLALVALFAVAPALQSQEGSGVYEITTLAGGKLGLVGMGSQDGIGTAARLGSPSGVAMDALGNTYIADASNHTIRKISPTGAVSTFAGKAGWYGWADGTGPEARFSFPRGVAIDSAGNVFVADTSNDTVRKISPEGVVTTLAGVPGLSDYGSVDGIGSAARMRGPAGIAVGAGGVLFVSDSNNNTIRKITPEGMVTTLAGPTGVWTTGNTDGVGAEARFNMPLGIAIDPLGVLYVADSENHTIRKITPTGVVSTLAGAPGMFGSTDGSLAEARFHRPTGITIDAEGNIFVADRDNSTIRRISPSGLVSTVAGKPGHIAAMNGTGARARFNQPIGVVVDGAGNVLVADSGNHTIRKVSPAGEVRTFAGSPPSNSAVDGDGLESRFAGPRNIALDGDGNLIVVDFQYRIIRKVTPEGIVTTIAGSPVGPFVSANSLDGNGEAAMFKSPAGVAVDGSGNIFVADESDGIIRKIAPDGFVSTFAGLTGILGSVDGTATGARFRGPSALAFGPDGNLVVADTFGATIRRITPAGVVTTIAGMAGQTGHVDGIGEAARFTQPRGVAVDSSGTIYVTDLHVIRKIMADGTVSTVAGLGDAPGYVDGTGAEARFSWPGAIAIDPSGNLLVPDASNNAIRRITPAGVVSTAAGTGSGLSGSSDSSDGVEYGPTFFNPQGIAIDAVGALYVADTFNHLIRLGIELPLLPEIVTAPVAQLAGRGRSATFSAVARGVGPLTYQWQRDGIAISGATAATYSIGEVQNSDAGTYTVVVSNANGSTTSAPTVLTVTDPPRLINMSARAFAGSGDATLVMGFHITGTGSKTVLIRGVGPKLAEYNVPLVVTNPALEIYRDKTLIDSNEDWDPSLAQDFVAAGAFALDAGSKDAALKVTLEPGGYTVHLVNTGPVAEALIEVYDLSKDEGSRLVNLSCRLNINAGETIYLGVGLINAPVPAVVRNVGPRLADFEVEGTLPDPHLRVFSGPSEVGANDDWDASLTPRFAEVGAFALVPDSKDAALQISLVPGLSSIHATGIGLGGVALVELYESP